MYTCIKEIYSYINIYVYIYIRVLINKLLSLLGTRIIGDLSIIVVMNVMMPSLKRSALRVQSSGILDKDFRVLDETS